MLIRREGPRSIAPFEDSMPMGRSLPTLSGTELKQSPSHLFLFYHNNFPATMFLQRRKD